MENINKSTISKSLCYKSYKNLTLNSRCQSIPGQRKIKKNQRYFDYLKKKKYLNAYFFAEKIQCSDENTRIFDEKFPGEFIFINLIQNIIYKLKHLALSLMTDEEYNEKDVLYEKGNFSLIDKGEIFLF
jgi:hypothetical protein